MASLITRRVLTSVPRSVRAVSTDLKGRLAELIPQKKEEVAAFRKEHGKFSLGDVTIDQAYAGMRDVNSLVTETSVLDAGFGIRYRGLSLPECQKALPTATGGTEMLPEGVFWLLLTGEVPTKAQVDSLSQEWAARASLPAHVVDMIAAFPNTLHPMSQFSAAICALQSESKFARAYAQGVHKSKYWDLTYEDSMDLIAKLPTVAAAIYRHIFHDGTVAAINPKYAAGALVVE